MDVLARYHAAGDPEKSFFGQAMGLEVEGDGEVVVEETGLHLL